MKQFIAAALLSFAYLFMFHDLAVAEGGDITDSGVRHKNTPRLFFVFSPDPLERQQHARQLQIMAKRHEQKLVITGIVRSLKGGVKDVAELEDFRSKNGLSYELLTTPVASLDPKVPRAVKENFAAVADFILLVDNSGDAVIVGDGDDRVQVDVAIGAGSLRTEVEENTWGKIKLLFN